MSQVLAEARIRVHCCRLAGHGEGIGGGVEDVEIVEEDPNKVNDEVKSGSQQRRGGRCRC